MMFNSRRIAGLFVVAVAAGCMPARQPVKKQMPAPDTAPADTMPVTIAPPPSTPAGPPTTEITGGPTTMPTPAVATADRGSITAKTPGLFPKKPFVKLPEHFARHGDPSTLLLEHASPDSPVPLSQFYDQPVRSLEDFHLKPGLTADQFTKKFGQPAQLAGVEDPWMVYRLTNTRELWLHFSPGDDGVLLAADVVRGAESGYIRTHVFTAD